MILPKKKKKSFAINFYNHIYVWFDDPLYAFSSTVLDISIFFFFGARFSQIISSKKLFAANN